jgi:hypothetical protein
MKSVRTIATTMGIKAPLGAGGLTVVFVLVTVVKNVLTDVATPVTRAVWVVAIEVTVLVAV